MRAGYVAERRVLFAEGRGTRISPPTHAQRVRMNGAPGETLRLRSVQALEHPAEAGRKAATKGNIGHSSMKKVIDHDLARPNEKWLARICFPLTAEDSQDGVDAENLWSEDRGDGSYVIDNIPFYAYEISNGDLVSARDVDGRLFFERVLERGGHSTYRVLVKNQAGFESDGFRRLWKSLQALGCSNEVAKCRWIAIDVPKISDPDAVCKILELGEEESVWTFEEAHCGHPL